MPDADVNHIYDYDPKYLADILSSVKTIALVGASADKTKFKYSGHEIEKKDQNEKLIKDICKIKY